MEETDRPANRTHFTRTVLLVWVLWLGIDFFAHAGLFAGLYRAPGPFLLPADELFARIPLGYAAFLIYVVLTVWLVRALGVTTPPRGAVVGGCFGAAVTIAGNLAVLSISTLGLSLAMVWTLVQVVEFALAGYFGVWIMREPSHWRAALRTAGITVGLVLAGVLAQNMLAA